ncbi:MAG TPA: hypothetical protein VFE41_03165 [Acetobacteraceae bacterium]|nr:hypothetical protein [Acetobacteraceae bacterium]
MLPLFATQAAEPSPFAWAKDRDAPVSSNAARRSVDTLAGNTLPDCMRELIWQTPQG